MRRARFMKVLVVLCALFLLTPVAASADPGAAQERPFKMEWSGPFEIVPEASWCDGLDGYVGVRLTITEGRVTHMGSTEGWGKHCSHLATGDLTRGNAVIVAANGDELHFTYTGSITPLSPSTVRIDATQVVDGGTGRFSSATGVAKSVCHATFTSPLAGFVDESRDVGVISYDASDRSG
ncbi:MAG: hypothetical protein ABFS21_04420 [Actinomycetota bacterium]